MTHHFTDAELALLDVSIEASVDVAMLFWPAFCADPGNADVVARLAAANEEYQLQTKARKLVEVGMYRRPA